MLISVYLLLGNTSTMLMFGLHLFHKLAKSKSTTILTVTYDLEVVGKRGTSFRLKDDNLITE